MMHACQRLLEDRTPGLLEAAHIRLEAVEFQPGAPPPTASDSMVTYYPARQEQEIDVAMDDKNEARVAAEASEDHSDRSDQATDADMPSSNNDDLHRQHDDKASAASDSDVEALAKSTDSDAEPHVQQDVNANDSSDSDVDQLSQTGEPDLMSNPAASADEETEHSDEQEETYQPIRLHATTSRFDDWLHRGPWLHSLPYFVYMHNIRRVRKVKASQASKQASQRFEFDKHYPLSDLYQQEMSKGVIPRLVGTQCKEDESNQREDYAIWHLALFGLARCPGTGCCCEVTMFKHMLTPKKSFRFPETSLPSLAHSYRPAWKTRLDELKRLCEQGRAKVEAAQRMPTIFDTSLVKHWTPEPAKPQQEEEKCSDAVLPRSKGASLERITLLQLTIAGLGQWQGAVFTNICVHMNITPGYHPHQLHLEEYAAIRSIEAISNINFQLLVAKKPFKVEAVNADQDTDGDDDLLPDYRSHWKEAECLGGDQDDDIEDEEYAGETVQRSKVHIDLDRSRQMLARKDEIARAKAPGRHKEMETQMKKYPEILQAVNNKNLPPIPNSKTSATTCFAAAPHNKELAAKHQDAMKIIIRSLMNAQSTNPEPPKDFNEDAWRAMLQRNAERDKPKCEYVPMEDMARGPGHVAWKLILDCKNKQP
ncbi:MAG: hypothetical protein MUQ52_01385, partial [Pirellulales bacterium]|nr:hypothetical protein [Pirellulales bacterium]